MIYFPETIKQWVQCYWWYLHTIFLLAMHVNSLCAWSHPEAVKGSSSFCLLILSRLLASPVWAQLTLTDPNWGPRSFYLQNGDPSHRVRAHSLTRVQNSCNASRHAWYWMCVYVYGGIYVSILGYSQVSRECKMQCNTKYLVKINILHKYSSYYVLNYCKYFTHKAIFNVLARLTFLSKLTVDLNLIVLKNIPDVN